MQMIEPERLTRPFMEAWKAAGMHLQAAAESDLIWLRANLHQPISEHLSFRLGNQLFFVFVEADSERPRGSAVRIEQSGTVSLNSSKAANAVPCRMQLTKRGDGWLVSHPGWGLIHAVSGSPIDPRALIDDQQIEMTEWELHDFAIQVVRDYLSKQGKRVTEWQSNLGIDPSIWFRDGDRFCWAVVRAVRFPEKEAPRPNNLLQLQRSCGPYGGNGQFASVAVANGDDPFDGSTPMPLFRGCGMYVSFSGLEPV